MGEGRRKQTFVGRVFLRDVARTNFNNLKLMSSNTHKNQIQSLSSLSLQHNIREIRDSQVFPQAQRKSSFDLVNMLAESQNAYLYRSKLEKSLDMLNSSLAINKIPQSPLQNFLQLTEEDRNLLERAGIQPSHIEQIESESDSYQLPEPLPSYQHHYEPEPSEQENNYIIVQYLPQDLAKLLQEKQIPLEYVRGLLLVREQKEIKSIRRLKVERYLEKRRKKTWDKKICYNCRQKVAEERLRIKGKFIKKRRAMQILGLTTPISTGEVKQMLEEMLKDKTLKQIEQIIRKEDNE